MDDRMDLKVEAKFERQHMEVGDTSMIGKSKFVFVAWLRKMFQMRYLFSILVNVRGELILDLFTVGLFMSSTFWCWKTTAPIRA